MQKSTKRIILRVFLTLIILVFATAGLLAWTFLGRSSVADGTGYGDVRIIKDGIVSVGIFPTDNQQVALIDAGNDPAGKAILAELQRRGLGPDSVTAILLTHGHPDHSAAIALFPHAQVMVLAADVPLVEGTGHANGPLTRLMPVHPTGVKVGRVLKDDETILLGTKAVHIFAVPGHTQGSAAYLVDGVLFLGDAADFGRDHALIGSPWIFSDSQTQDRESLMSLERRLLPIADQVKAIDCAHSGLFSTGLAPLTQFARG